MKIFIINLEHQTEKRQFMQAQLERLGLTAEFIPAINGKKMSLTELKQKTHDYDHSYLTAGEIGCALSHIAAYQKMTDAHIKHALILEDDAVLGDDLSNLLTCIQEFMPYQATAYLLTTAEVYDRKPITQLLEKHHTHRVLRSTCTHGYVLNLAAAQNLSKKLLPIRFEADRWDFFYRAGYIDFYCVVPVCINSQDDDKAHSTIEEDRKPLVQARHTAYEKLIKQEMPTHLRIKWALWRLFKRPFIQKIKS